jgi:transcriptional regulator of arginine metabolism
MPSESEIRERRHREILTLLRRKRVRSQAELVEQLDQRGIEATQSSVSRDLRDLGVAKVAGRYLAPPLRQGATEGLEQAARFLVGIRPAGPHLTVVLTLEGAAQTVGLAIDKAELSEVVGTLAGDDTVFVATSSAADQNRLLHRFRGLLEGAAS